MSVIMIIISGCTTVAAAAIFKKIYLACMAKS